MPSKLQYGLVCCALSPALTALAQAPETPPAAPQTAASAASAAAPSPASDFDGTIGLTGAYRPRYPGAPKQGFHGTPGFYLRWGRYTITNASGFAPRRSEDVVRGLGVEVLQSDRIGVSFSLRYDSGRRENSSPAYAGLGNIHSTLRARVAVSYDLRVPWRLGASWNVDAAGRGNGGVGDISGGWDRHLGERTTLSVGSSLSFGDARYMQAYYGITDAQSARSVYPAYRADAGLRDIGISAGLRRDIARDWVALAGIGATRLLGSAATSPITRDRNGWGVNAGLGWRF